MEMERKNRKDDGYSIKENPIVVNRSQTTFTSSGFVLNKRLIENISEDYDFEGIKYIINVQDDSVNLDKFYAFYFRSEMVEFLNNIVKNVLQNSNQFISVYTCFKAEEVFWGQSDKDYWLRRWCADSEYWGAYYGDYENLIKIKKEKKDERFKEISRHKMVLSDGNILNDVILYCKECSIDFENYEQIMNDYCFDV